MSLQGMILGLAAAVATGVVTSALTRRLLAGRVKADLVPYASREGGFTVLFPASPKQEQQTVNTPEGRIHVKTVQKQTGPFFFAASHCDYPQHVIDAAFPEKMLDGARDGAVANVHGKLLSETVFDHKGHEGREIHFRVNPKAAGRMRLLLIGRRLYQLQVVAHPDFIHNRHVGMFFESFQAG